VVVTGVSGSGKSSLMRLARRRLEDDGHGGAYLCVEFSPWRHEDGADVKAALMATVMDALDSRVEGTDAKPEVTRRVRRLRRWAHGWALPKALVTGGSMAAGLEPELASMAGDIAQQAAAGDDAEDPEPVVPRTFESVARFHEEFAELMSLLEDDVQALVVFVDDLDRCLPPAIVSTFEAIRLFLQAPRTAYVVGAHQRIIQAALDERYPAASDADQAIGVDYLEKVLQLTIAIPPLSGPETVTYANLLFAELYTDDDDFGHLLTEARRLRAADQLAEAMNEGVASGVLAEVPEKLSEAFELVHRAGPTLASGTRGNPRQIKRFLNTLLLRTRTAAKRGAPIKPGVLAKLMLLEERHLAEFERLYQWQLAAAGAPLELAVAEAEVRGVKAPKTDAAQRAAVDEWVGRPGVPGWLALEPSLAGVALGPYFSLARDKLSTATPAIRLPAHLQELVVALQAPIDRDRDAAVKAAGELTPQDRALLGDALFGVAAREPGSDAMHGAAALAGAGADVADAFFATLRDLPPSRVPVTLPGAVALRFRDDARLASLLSAWEKGPKRLAAAVELVRGS